MTSIHHMVIKPSKRNHRQRTTEHNSHIISLLCVMYYTIEINRMINNIDLDISEGCQFSHNKLCGKHVYDFLISLRRDVWAHKKKTSLISQLFIY